MIGSGGGTINYILKNNIYFYYEIYSYFCSESREINALEL